MTENRDWNAEVIAEFRANAGEVVAPYPDPPPMLVLHTIGAQTGKEHVVPMRCLVDGDAFYVFATAHGSDRDPDWFHNLVANPDIVVELGAKTLPVRATVLAGSDRERILAAWVERVPLVAKVIAQTERTIPVIRVDPRPGSARSTRSTSGDGQSRMQSAHEQRQGAMSAWLAEIDREVLGWSGMAKERKEQGPGGIGVTVYRLGRTQIGHVHDAGAADFLVSRALREELIRDGRAGPHPAFPTERTVVSYQIRGADDVPRVLDLFRLNLDRLRAVRERRGSTGRLADESSGTPGSEGEANP